jgi:hypothetical protein
MSLFGNVKKMWYQSGMETGVQEVINEAAKGNATEVQRWYYKIKKDSYKQSLNLGLDPAEVERQALESMSKDTVRTYEEIVERLSRSGGPLEEVNEWLKSNKPM